MAKQTSLIKINGKADGQSFYTSKNGGALMRSINKGMSARVKDGKEYINTRKNNAEFGMCGDFAGAIIKPISLRWRFILDSIATGKLVKTMKELVILDAVNAWGQRVISNANFDTIREALNSFSKNEMIQRIVTALQSGVVYNPVGNIVNIGAMPQLTVADQQELLAEGVNYFITKVYGLSTTVPAYDANAMAYTKAETHLFETNLETSGEIDGSAALDLLADTEGDCSLSIVDSATNFGGLLVVFMPARKVGSSISVLQEKCSAYIAPATAAN